MAKRLSKTLWYGTGLDTYGKPLLPPVATNESDLNGLHRGELFMHLDKDNVTLWALSSNNEVVQIAGKQGEIDIDLSDYLLKSTWDKVWELRKDNNGVEYIYSKLPVITRYGITMYADNGEVEVESIYAGLPIDRQTLIWKDGLLMVNPELDLGGGGGIDEDGLRDYLTRNDYAKKSDITTALNGYATISSLNAVSTKLNDFLEGSDTDTVINKWKELETFLSGLTESDNLATILTGKADKSYVDTNFITIAGTEDVTGLHNFVNGLKIGGIELIKKQDDVVYLDGNLVVRGGITMYGDGEGGSSVPLYSTLGSLLNVDESNDAVASVDRVLFQSAGSNVWSWKALSEIGGGSSGGGSVSGDYLPLSGGTLTGKLTIGLASAVPLVLQNTSATNSYIDFKANGWSTTKTGGVGIIREPYLGNEVTLLACGDPRILVSEKGGIYYQEGYNTETFPILHSGNYSSYALPLSGGTLTNSGTALIIRRTGTYANEPCISYGTGETLYGSIGVTDYNTPFYFNYKTSQITTIWHSGNDGSGSGLDADLLDGKHYSDIVNGNVASATKLQTARTIWGQSFDGTANITTGDITAYASSNDTTSLNLFKANGDVGWQLSGRYGSDLGLKIYYYDKSSWNNYLRIYTNGNVEVYQSLTIGSPYIGNGNLRVGGRSYFGDWVYLFDNSSNTSNNNSSRLYFAASGYDKGVFLQGINVGTYGRKRLGVFVNNEASYSATAWDEALSVLPDGKVGIGIPNPTEKLDINGHMIIRGAGDNLASINLYNSSTSLWQISARFTSSDKNLKFYYYNGSAYNTYLTISQSGGNMLVAGGVTMYSDQRKKTILNHVELSLKQIADAPLIEHYYNSDQEKTTHVGSIAQYWASLNDWFCKLDAEGFYTMEIQNCALASAISIARELEKYESKTDKTIRKMKQRIAELEEQVERLKNN